MDLKRKVKKRYGRIARGGGSCCGRPSGIAGDQKARARAIGYREQDLAAAPDDSNLGLGCGNPVALAEVRPGDTVLDLGSGAGFDCFLAASRVGPNGRVIGVDMTREMIAKARRSARKAGVTNVEFRLGEIESLPVEDESIDLVISNCVLNLVPDKAAAFREIARVLKPGGRVMISDILRRGELPAEVACHPDSHVACISGAIEPEEYLGLMRAAGLSEAEVISETDAADLFAAAECGRSDPALAPLVERLRGKIVSANVRARKPAS